MRPKNNVEMYNTPAASSMVWCFYYATLFTLLVAVDHAAVSAVDG